MFSKIVLLTIGYPYAKHDLLPLLPHHTQKLTRNVFGCECKTMKLLEENIGENLCVLGLGETFCREHIKKHEA